MVEWMDMAVISAVRRRLRFRHRVGDGRFRDKVFRAECDPAGPGAVEGKHCHDLVAAQRIGQTGSSCLNRLFPTLALSHLRYRRVCISSAVAAGAITVGSAMAPTWERGGCPTNCG